MTRFPALLTLAALTCAPAVAQQATFPGTLADHALLPAMTLVPAPADAPGISAISVVGKDWRAQRSGGFEGMALQPGTGLLWGMLEKPLMGEDGKPEGNFLRVMAFDPAKAEWTGATMARGCPR